MKRIAVPLVLALTLVLAACAAEPEAAPTEPPAASETPTATPTPTPEPTRPALAELVLTPEGLGTLAIGTTLPGAPDDLALVHLDPELCVDYGADPGSALAAGWAPDDSFVEDGRAPFQIGFAGDTLVRVDVYGPGVRTEGGLQVGDPVADVAAKAPDAVKVTESDISRLYVQKGTTGQLLIEVAVEGAGFEGYWQGKKNQVLFMRAISAGETPTPIAGGDNVVFGCSFTP